MSLIPDRLDEKHVGLWKGADEITFQEVSVSVTRASGILIHALKSKQTIVATL